MNGFTIAALGSLLVAAPGIWGLHYTTSLETSAYQANKKLVGQDGWTNLVAEESAMVVANPATAASGRNAVVIRADDPKLDSYPWGPFTILNGVWERLVTVDHTSKPTIVRVEADMRLDGPDTGDGPGADMLSGTLYARNGRHRSPFFWISSNGTAYANSFTDDQDPNTPTEYEYWYQFETPIKVGEYNNFKIDLNYATHMATFIVNQKVIGSLPFGGANEGFISPALEIAAIAETPLIPGWSPKPYVLYYDNISVLSRPAN